MLLIVIASNFAIANVFFFRIQAGHQRRTFWPPNILSLTFFAATFFLLSNSFRQLLHLEAKFTVFKHKLLLFLLATRRTPTPHSFYTNAFIFSLLPFSHLFPPWTSQKIPAQSSRPEHQMFFEMFPFSTFGLYSTTFCRVLSKRDCLYISLAIFHPLFLGCIFFFFAY